MPRQRKHTKILVTLRSSTPKALPSSIPEMDTTQELRGNPIGLDNRSVYDRVWSKDTGHEQKQKRTMLTSKSTRHRKMCKLTVKYCPAGYSSLALWPWKLHLASNAHAMS